MDNNQNVGPGLAEVFLRLFGWVFVICLIFTPIAILLGLPAWPK